MGSLADERALEQDRFTAVLHGARSGDPDHVAELWRWVHPRITRYLRVVAPEAAEDIASETWIAIARGLDGFSGDQDGFGGWVHTLARNRMLDYRRHSARRVPEVHLEAVAEPAGGTEPPEAVLERLSFDKLLAVIGELPPDQAEAVSLRVVSDLSVSETAAVMKRSEGAVRVLSHRGLRNLARRLAPIMEADV